MPVAISWAGNGKEQNGYDRKGFPVWMSTACPSWSWRKHGKRSLDAWSVCKILRSNTYRLTGPDVLNTKPTGNMKVDGDSSKDSRVDTN